MGEPRRRSPAPPEAAAPLIRLEVADQRSPSDLPNTRSNAGVPKVGSRRAVASVSCRSDASPVPSRRGNGGTARRRAYCALPEGQSSSPPDAAVDRLEAGAAVRRVVDQLTEVAAVHAALPGLRALLERRDPLDLPQRQGEVREDAAALRPNTRRSPPDPPLRTPEVHDVRVLVREDESQPVVGVADQCCRRAVRHAVISIRL